MIDLKELRIGNWIKDSTTGEIFQIYSESFTFIEGIEDQYEPIPLTPEILGRCGFACLDGECDLSIGPNIYFKYDKHANTVTLIVDDYYLECYDYLHELQNVYYWLKKEELVIKELQNA